MYHSPGVKYSCPRCESSSIGFIIDEKFKEWLEIMLLINARKVKLSNSYRDYKVHPKSMKWMCYKCRDCGIVLSM